MIEEVILAAGEDKLVMDEDKLVMDEDKVDPWEGALVPTGPE